MPETCQVVVKYRSWETPTLCGNPASFLYIGVPNYKNPEKIERARLYECMKHIRDTFIKMEPALREGSAVVRCVVQTKLTVHCAACGSLFRFEPLPPTVHKMPGRFCPNCGQSAVAFFDPQLDYWELMAKELPGELAAGLVAELHSHWVKDTKTEQQFVEYIKSVWAEE
jgi:hypothetical protein